MDKHLEIQRYLAKKKVATLQQIFNDMEFCRHYYCNGEKHLGNILSRMVKKGTIERVKKGTFKHIETNVAYFKRQEENKNQNKLF
jgi:predicted transcriptional regulator of viral defense system